MKRYRNHQIHKTRKRSLFIVFLIFVVLVIIFVPGPNGLIKVIHKSYKIDQLRNEMENLKIKAELLESKISKGQNPEYLRKYLIDYYKMVPKDSSK